LRQYSLISSLSEDNSIIIRKTNRRKGNKKKQKTDNKKKQKDNEEVLLLNESRSFTFEQLEILNIRREKKDPVTYDMYALICYDFDQEHYTCFIRNIWSTDHVANWYKYDNDYISQVTFSSGKRTRNSISKQEKIIDPYLFFYKRREEDNLK